MSRLGNLLLEWTARYLPLEFAATGTALVGGLTAAAVTNNPVIIAYAGAWGENVGYYGVAFGREMRSPQRLDAENRVGSPSRALRVLKQLLWEFGAAEVADSLVLRPAAMFAATELLGSFGWGIVAGKLAADAVFYAVAITFYEWGKRR